MTLTDTGPLVAILDQGDPYHSLCLKALPALSRPLITTLPTLTEAMYFLGKQFGWRGQIPLWEMIQQGRLEVASIERGHLDRMETLMEEYSDSPMDFADASLIATAEAKGLRRIFTLDSHFHAYKPRHVKGLDVIPRP